MALTTFVVVGHEIEKTTPAFWFLMQIGMLAGFAVSYPVNWAASRPSGTRASRPTAAPRAPYARATARPSPADAPVTTTT